MNKIIGIIVLLFIVACTMQTIPPEVHFSGKTLQFIELNDKYPQYYKLFERFSVIENYTHLKKKINDLYQETDVTRGNQ